MATTAVGKMVEGMVNSVEPSPNAGWTLGWDVVVSYSQKEMNQLLRSRWEKHRDEMLTKIETSVEEEDYYDPDRKRTIQYDLDLGPPLVEFPTDTVAPVVDLVLPVVGGTHGLDDPKAKRLSLPTDGYQIRISDLPLGTVTGTYEEVKGHQPGKPLDVKGGCVFRKNHEDREGDDFEVSWVVLDIPLDAKKMKVACERLSDDTTDSNRRNAIEKGFRAVKQATSAFFDGTSANHFRDRFNLIRHALATVKNQVPRQPGVTADLTPVSFRLATCSNSTLKHAALSLFIHVVGGKDSGEKIQLQDSWRGQWVNAKPNPLTPIPEGHTASIMIHPELIYQRVIAPSVKNKWHLERVDDGVLQRLRVKQNAKGDGDVKGGIAFQTSPLEPYAYNQTQISATRTYEEAFLISKYSWWISAVSAPLKESPATIQIFQKDMESAPVVHIYWHFDITSELSEWVWKEPTDLNPIADPGWRHIETLNMNTKYTIDHALPMEIKVSDFDLTFNIDTKKMENHWELQDEVLSPPPGLFKRLLEALDPGDRGFTEEDRIVYKEGIFKDRTKMLRDFRPDLQFRDMGLGFFLTTNLLNPGAKVIKVDDKIGVRMPGNLLLVGNMEQGVDEVKTAMQ